MIARDQTADLPAHLRFALDAGVKPSELAGIITHLAFYAGWENAMAAVTAAHVVLSKNNDPDIIRRCVAAEPIGRLGEPEDIAAAVAWPCSPAASFMVGHAMAVDGGVLA